MEAIKNFAASIDACAAETLRALVLIGMAVAAVGVVKSVVQKNRALRPRYDAPHLPGAATALDGTNIVSVFKVRFNLPLYSAEYENGKKRIPFYLVPFRENKNISFPLSGYSWYNRDDVMSIIAWIEKFDPGFAHSKMEFLDG